PRVPLRAARGADPVAGTPPGAARLAGHGAPVPPVPARKPAVRGGGALLRRRAAGRAVQPPPDRPALRRGPRLRVPRPRLLARAAPRALAGRRAPGGALPFPQPGEVRLPRGREDDAGGREPGREGEGIPRHDGELLHGADGKGARRGGELLGGPRGAAARALRARGGPHTGDGALLGRRDVRLLRVRPGAARALVRQT